MKTDTLTAIDQVIANENCIGCGACAFADPDAFKINRSEDGHNRARRIGQAEADISALCPMSGSGEDEDQLAANLWPDLPKDISIGRYRECLAGHVVTDDIRMRATSGGAISWVLRELLEQGHADAVIHVKPADGPLGELFTYAVSESPEAIMQGAKSRYYPIEMSEILEVLRSSPKRYVVVGLPCFIKTIRLLQRQQVSGIENVHFCIGLICGHLKSIYFADYLATQVGAQSGTIKSFDFRRKLEGRPASRYGFAFRADEVKSETVVPMSSVEGGDWGKGLFKNPACEYCDDVVAECADLVVGDAWLPRYQADWKGTSILVVRDQTIGSLLAEGRKDGRLVLDDVSVEDVVASQRSGLFHRRIGLAHRLARRGKKGQWAPRKRVTPQLASTVGDRMIFDTRESIAKKVSATYAQTVVRGAGLEVFHRRIKPLLFRYRLAFKVRTFMRRITPKAKTQTTWPPSS